MEIVSKFLKEANNLKRNVFNAGFFLLDEKTYLQKRDKIKWINNNLKRYKESASFKDSGFYFMYDSTIDFYVHEHAGCKLAIFGEFFDATNLGASKSNICYELICKYNISRDSFSEELTKLAGRYVIFVIKNGDLDVFPDACSLRSIYYLVHNEYIALCSHTLLISQVFNLKLSDYYRYTIETMDFKKGEKQLPGDVTKYHDLKVLLPNHTYSTANKGIKRFFPISTSTKEYSYSICENILLNSAKYYTDKSFQPISLSLTGGIDSRVTMVALLSQKASIDSYTYINNNFSRHKADAEKANQLARLSGTTHSILYVSKENYPSKYDSDLKELWDLHTDGLRGQFSVVKRVSRYLSKNVYDTKSLFMEIGRAFYQKQGCRSTISSANFSNIYALNKKDDRTKEIFNNYIIENQFGQDHIYNFDALDLFYWEQRVGQWANNIMMEMDLYCRPFSLFNCRLFFENLLAQPVSDRSGSLFQKQFIESNFQRFRKIEFN